MATAVYLDRDGQDPCRSHLDGCPGDGLTLIGAATQTAPGTGIWLLLVPTL